MSSYDDPRWYEQEPEQTNTNASSLDTSSHNNSEPVAIPPSILNSHEQPEKTAEVVEEQPLFPPRRGYEPEQRIYRFIRQIVLITAIIVVAFLAGWFSHQLFTNNFNASTPSRSYQSLFDQAWNIVDQNYVDRKAVNYQQMSYQAIQAMLGVLHDTGHTRFLTPADVQSENQSLSGSFTGIGIYLTQDAKTKQVIITATVPGSPADKAGFKRGDVIVAVNGTNVVGKDIPTISKLIQGPVNTSVSLMVLRPSSYKTLTIKVTRAVI